MKNRKDFVASLARGIEIIRAFTSEQAVNHSTARASVGPADALTLSQVAERVGVARAVARRFLLTFADLGYVVADGKYRFSGRTVKGQRRPFRFLPGGRRSIRSGAVEQDRPLLVLNCGTEARWIGARDHLSFRLRR